MHDAELTGTTGLHAGKRRWLLVVGGNVLLLVVMLGLPWLRGHLRTRALWQAFARYGACLYAGEPAASPGLGLPVDHEARFATRALREPGFAARCDALLSELAPAPATFVMPSLKVAESDVRAAAKLVRDELAPLAARTPGTRLSVRPLRAIERLRAGLVNHATASGALVTPEDPAFTLHAGETLPTPARLPLFAGADAQVALWGDDSEAHALATDLTGVSYVHVREGKLEQSRVPRPKLLEAAVPHEVPSTFVWATPRARCAERAGGCAGKALGVAPVVLPVSTLPEPRWLGAHPSGRIDRSLFRAGTRIAIAAERGDGATELREFALPLEAEASAATETPPLHAVRTWSSHTAGKPLVLAQGDAPRLFVARDDGDRALLAELTPTAERALDALPGGRDAWVVGCSEPDRIGLVLGHAGALKVADARAESLSTHAPLSFGLRDVVDARDAARDRVVRVCGFGPRAVVVVHDARDRLWLVVCEPAADACRRAQLAQSVRGFAALAAGERLVVAHAGEGDWSQIRVRSVALDRPESGDEQVPAICWSDARGFCGRPLLARVGARILLAAREGTDLRVLESNDAGQHWQPLTGLMR